MIATKAAQTLIKKKEYTEEQNEIIRHYHEHYLKNFWCIYKSIVFFLLLITFLVLNLYPVEHSNANVFSKYYCPFVMVALTYADYLSKKDAKKLSNIVLGMAFMNGFDFTIITILDPEFTM